MKHRLSIAIFFTTFAIPSAYCMDISVSEAAALATQRIIAHIAPETSQWHNRWHIGLEYEFGGKAKNPNGDLSMTLGYRLQTHNNSFGLKNISCDFQYENKPGLLGQWGHLQGKIDVSHEHRSIDMCAKIITADINTMLNYNPETIARNEKLIADLKEYKKKHLDTHKLLLAKTMASNASLFSINKQIFLSHKSSFESRPFDENDPKAVKLKIMLEELEKIYGS